VSRRAFLAGASAVTAASLWRPRPAGAASASRAGLGHILVPTAGRWSDPDPAALAALAVEAAMAAGARYADARLSLVRSEVWGDPYPTTPGGEAELHGVGVRALLPNGYWGFFGSALWATEEMARLGRGAVAQAKSNALGRTREVSLGTIPRVENGDWTMPVTYDPFTISIAEKSDYMNSVEGAIQQLSPLVGGGLSAKFGRAERVFASSEGSSWRQTTYLTEGTFAVGYKDEPGDRKYSPAKVMARTLSPAGRGWEYICESGLLEQVPAMLAEAEQSRDPVAVDIGRYDIVCSAWATASLLARTIGTATELDRAMGFEANATGTSYLDDPLAMLGSYSYGTPLLTVTANRSRPGGAATVRWDDEGVVPEEFALVREGTLTDFQTTREQAAWLAPAYGKTGRPVRSNGCANGSWDAACVPLDHPPNLVMAPGGRAATFDDLVAGTEKGYAVLSADAVLMDAQQLNGLAMGTIREITRGKLGRLVYSGALDIRAPELWKSLDAVGGPGTSESLGVWSTKGEPTQNSVFTVEAVPAKFKGVPVIDMMRKA